MDANGPTLARACADYLAHSRGHDLYASEDDYWRADDKWWQAIVEAWHREIAPMLQAGLADDRPQD